MPLNIAVLNYGLCGLLALLNLYLWYDNLLRPNKKHALDFQLTNAVLETQLANERSGGKTGMRRTRMRFQPACIS